MTNLIKQCLISFVIGYGISCFIFDDPSHYNSSSEDNSAIGSSIN